MERYIIADTHFFDDNIRKYENRPFKSVSDMNESLIKNWNTTVENEDDEVFVVGDFFSDCATDEQVLKVIMSLKGKIILIRGNHDSDRLVDLYKRANVSVIEYPIILDEFFILSHYPMYVSEQMPYANVFGHVHNSPTYQTVSKRSACVSVERLGYKPVSFNIIKYLIAQQNEKE